MPSNDTVPAATFGTVDPADVEAFAESLPAEFAILGRRVKLELKEDGKAHVSTSPEVTLGAVTNYFLIETESEAQALTDKEKISEFLKFFLKTPIGPRVLNFRLADSHSPPNPAWLRRDFAISCAYVARRELSRQRDKKGFLRESMQCIALPVRGIYVDEQCRNQTKHPSGFCNHHREPGIHHLFNFYPFFANSGQA